jgi:uncharacterized protein (TIGR01777 family)
MTNKIIIAGGSGFLGQTIIEYLNTPNTSFVVFTRAASQVRGNVTYIHWDGKTIGNWCQELEGALAIINLTGKSVNCRYTEKNKREILDSRVDATAIIGQAIQHAKNPPATWINASSIAIFGYSTKRISSEAHETANGFSAQVCEKWEAAFNQSQTPHTKKVILRIGVVLQKGIGLLQPFAKLVKFGFGGKIGDGQQYMSWIHEQDFINILIASLNDERFKGTIHCTAPTPIKNEDFMHALRNALHIRHGLNNPKIFVKMGAYLIGTEAELVLKGRNVTSDFLKAHSFEFKFPTIGPALNNLYS